MPQSIRLSDKKAIEAKLLSRRRINENNCWIFTKGLDENGYGILQIEFHSYRVHRLAAYIWLDYDIELSPQLVLHKMECHNPSCFNPEHLYIGSAQENIQDSIRAGTHNTVTRLLKTHCKWGHEYTSENTYTDKRGGRRCKQCHNEKEKVRGQINRDIYGGWYK